MTVWLQAMLRRIGLPGLARALGVHTADDTDPTAARTVPGRPKATPRPKGLWRLMSLACVVGGFTGLAAVVFHAACIWVTQASLVHFSGYQQGGPANEIHVRNPFSSVPPEQAATAEPDEDLDITQALHATTTTTATTDKRSTAQATDPANAQAKTQAKTLAKTQANLEANVAASASAADNTAANGEAPPTHGPHFVDVQTKDIVPWALVLLPTIGGLISGVLVYTIAPAAEGHGTDSAIAAYHHRAGRIPLRVGVVKLVASAVTIGTGGSGGREGPIAQIGASMGSFLATKLGLSDSERRVMLSSGLGAGIGAIFHAPLAGAIFAIEVLYRDPDFEAEGLIPAFISTAVAYSVYSSCFGVSLFRPLFDVVAIDPGTLHPLLLMLPLAVLALAMAAASWFYVRVFYGIHALFKRLPVPRIIKPMIGAMLTGLLALGLYFGAMRLGPSIGMDAHAPHDVLSVLSFGYGFLQKLLGPEGASLGVGVLIAVALGKLLTTSLTIGSGGSGGVFGPSMVIGGAFGGVVGIVLASAMPYFVPPHSLPLFVVLGMAGFFAAAANTPVSTLIMVSELTNSYSLLLPSMWVCAIAYLVSHRWTLYTEQVKSRLESPAHRGDFIVDILKGMTVREALADHNRRYERVGLGTPITEVSRMITLSTQSCFPVFDDDGRYYGLFSLNDVREFLYESGLGDLACAQDLATAGVRPLTLSMDLSDVLSEFARSRFDELLVVDLDSEADRGGEAVAMLRRRDVLNVYNRKLLDIRATGKG